MVLPPKRDRQSSEYLSRSMPAPQLLGLLQALAHPIGHGRAVLVRDVIADVVAVRVHQQRRLRRLARDPFGLRWRKKAIQGAVDDQERTGDLVQDAAQRERLG